MTDNKVSLEVLTDSLLEESSRKFEESVGLKWEWDHYLKLYDLVTKIQEKERNRDRGDDLPQTTTNNKLDRDAAEKNRREQSFPAFLQWLQNQGVSMDSVEINYTGLSSGFGLKTTKDLKAGETVFQVPEKIILTSYKAKSSDSSLKLIYDKDPILRSMQNVAIALFLVYEKYGNKDSQWLPYLNTLPAFYDSILYFTKDEMSLLKSSPAAFREALKMYRNVARQYAYFHQKFKKANDTISRVFRRILTFNRYVWGVSSVTTRINYLPNPDGEEIMSLIPLWDMCNHEEQLGQVSTDFDDNTRTLTCFAARDFPKGSEYKIYYGHRTSVEYLVHNGFVPREYRDDTYCLELGVGVNDACYVRKKALLGHVGLMCHNIFPVKPDRMQSSKGLFLFIRVFLADKDVLETMEMNSDDLGYLNEPTEQSLKFLSTRFMLLKRSVENSKGNVLKNMEDLEQNLCPKRATMILQVLSNEQTVLEMLISSTNNLLNRLQS